MTDQLSLCIVRIFAARGLIAGSGFLASEKHVLTCAHVVAQALDIPEDSREIPPGEVHLDFPLVAPGKKLTARVIHWQPVKSAPPTEAESGEDIALLELATSSPDGSRPARLIVADDLWGHSFRAFGFPSGHDQGVWTSGVVRAGQSSGWVQIEDVKETGYLVAPGFSGTPVWDEQAEGVVGIVIAAERRPDVRAAFIIPTSILFKAWPRETAQADRGTTERELSVEVRAFSTASQPQRARLFISYKRDADPDERVALEVCEALRQQHDVFIDQDMPVGTRWAERIDAELRRADFLIVFLSVHAAHSEMLKGEIETAHNLAKERAGRPAILPVRLAYREPFQYPLSAYLNSINWAFWRGPEDTPRLIEELSQAITGSALPIGTTHSRDDLLQPSEPQLLPPPLPSAQPMSLEMPEGTMDPQSKFYVVRASDATALAEIQRQGVTITIKGPRQMGKSSLLSRVIDAAHKANKRVVFLDFELFDRTVLTDADRFFRQFCTWLTDELNMEDRVDTYWKMPLGNTQRCTRYVGRYLLEELGSPLVLAIDEADSILDTDFQSDFFGMLRSWHNNRATNRLWKQLDLTLVISTEPYQLIENLHQSPFNIGHVIELSDFTLEQVADLNRRHGLPLNPEEERQLLALLGGHPYLVRRALYLAASHYLAITELFANASNDRGPFGDHLRYHLLRIYNKRELVQGLLQVIRHHICQDEQVFHRLQSAGLVRREGHSALPRCQLYVEYFEEHLHG